MSIKSLINLVIEQNIQKEFLVQIFTLSETDDEITKKQVEATNFFISYMEEDLCPVIIEAIQEVT